MREILQRNNVPTIVDEIALKQVKAECGTISKEAEEKKVVEILKNQLYIA